MYAAGSLQDIWTGIPPLGAGPLRVTLPSMTVPPGTVSAFAGWPRPTSANVSPVKRIGGTEGAAPPGLFGRVGCGEVGGRSGPLGGTTTLGVGMRIALPGSVRDGDELGPSPGVGRSEPPTGGRTTGLSGLVAGADGFRPSLGGDGSGTFAGGMGIGLSGLPGA